MLVEANHISLDYLTGDFQNMGIKEALIKKIKGEKIESKFRALTDISFNLERGDMLGIIGGNGAGKSTLLKVITGVLTPTEGDITVNGEISSLISLGTGFDGRLSVKENIYLRGSLLGYSKQFIDEMYPDIIEFSELSEFETRQFSHLSSGMRSRLAFSVSCLIKPDILILDEVFAVGDASFRQKSEKKMNEIIKDGAATILVSHSLQQIERLCNKVLWIHKGHQIAFGSSKDICRVYADFMSARPLYR